MTVAPSPNGSAFSPTCQAWERELAAVLVEIARHAVRRKAATACEAATAQEERRADDTPA